MARQPSLVQTLKLACECLLDKLLQRTLKRIEPKIAVFDQLREAMRIAPISGSKGLNCDGMDTDIQSVQANVRKFRRLLTEDPHTASNQEYQNMVKQIEKYWEKLFADPIEVDTAEGKVLIQPQRTNNIMERFFRDLKTGYRRKSGHNGMSRTFQAMLADTPLVKYLENESYMQILLKDTPSLETRFAEIDITTVRNELNDA